MRIWWLVALFLAPTLLLACSGSHEPDTSKPQGVVRMLLDGIAGGDQQRIADAIDPVYNDTPGSVGIEDILNQAKAGQLSFEKLSLRAEYDSSRENARVFVSTQIVSTDANGEESATDVTNRVLLTSKIDGRWYVTSEHSSYWSAQLKPQPADWKVVQEDSNPDLPGQYIPPHPGADGELYTADDRAHVANGTVIPICTQAQLDAHDYGDPLCYPSNPPTSGPHAATPAPFRVFTQPTGKEYLVHNLEHGGVVFWYNTDDQQAIALLTDVVKNAIAQGELVALTPYPDMEPNTIALTAWTRLDKFPVSELTRDRAQHFIDVYERRFNPEGF